MSTPTPAKVTAWSSAKQVRPGDRVRVVAGHLAGLTGVVCNTDGANAVFTADGLKGIYIRMSIAKLEEQLREPAALPGEAKSDCELREFVLGGVLRLRDDLRRKRRQSWWRVLYIVFSCTLYVAGSALMVVLMTAPVRPSHRLATLGANKTSDQNSELISGKQTLITISR